MITNDDRRYLARALNASTHSTFGRVRIGAVVADRFKDVVGIGYNQRRTHPRQYAANKRTGKQIENPCIHAEVAAILDAKQYYGEENWRDAKPHTIYVARLDRNGKWANCKPCAACHSEIVAAGIKRVVYTTEQGIEEYKVNERG